MSDGPAHRVQSAVVEYGFPNGHLGHLSEAEETALTNFKLKCEEEGYYKSSTSEDGKPSHDDPTMLRYLRARRFVVADAFVQFKDTEEWRKANQLDELYETIDIEQYDETRHLYPQWTGRRDRRGIPVYVYEIKNLTAKTMHAYEKSATSTSSQATTATVSPKLIRLFALYENLTRFVLPLCTALTDRDHPRTPITQSNNIVDISGVGLKQFWNLRSHMQDASQLATAHYPETLDRIFIIGAPYFFPTVWGWIKKWFDPITTSKIFIIPASEVKSTLETFIDPANIPKKYGGQLDFNFGDFPVPDPALEKIAEWNDGFKDFPPGPKYWVDVTKGVRWEDGVGGEKIKAVAVGSVNGKVRKEDIVTVTRVLESAVQPETQLQDRSLRPELLTVPTAQNSTSNLPTTSNLVPVSSQSEYNTEAGEPVEPVTPPDAKSEASSGVKLQVNGTSDVAIDENKVSQVDSTNIKESNAPVRPEVERFVTAHENLQDLKLSDTTADNKTNGGDVKPVFSEKLQEGVVPAMKKLDA